MQTQMDHQVLKAVQKDISEREVQTQNTITMLKVIIERYTQEMLDGKDEKDAKVAIREVINCLQAATDQAATDHFYEKDGIRFRLKSKKSLKEKKKILNQVGESAKSSRKNKTKDDGFSSDKKKAKNEKSGFGSKVEGLKSIEKDLTLSKKSIRKS